MKIIRSFHFLMVTVALSFTAVPAIAQQSSLRMKLLQTEIEASRLREAPKHDYKFLKAPLGDLIRILALDAHISLIPRAQSATEEERLITFVINSSPFGALETICKANGLTLILEDGDWCVRPSDDKDLVARDYEIKSGKLQKDSDGSAPRRAEVLSDVRSILDLPSDRVAASAKDEGNDKPKVLWKENSNTLCVVGTRTQQMWVEGYLATRDRP
jgi:hypothetical protein